MVCKTTTPARIWPLPTPERWSPCRHSVPELPGRCLRRGLCWARSELCVPRAADGSATGDRDPFLRHLLTERRSVCITETAGRVVLARKACVPEVTDAKS